MANDLNQCNFIGRLGADVEQRFLPSGDAVSNFRIAVGKQWRDKQSGSKQEATTWVQCVAFGKLAEVCGQYLSKGSRIFVSGELSVRKWQAQDGADRYSTEIKVRDMQMLDSRQGGQSQHGNQPPQQQYQPPQSRGGPGAPNTGGFDDFDQEIPFAPLHNAYGG